LTTKLDRAITRKISIPDTTCPSCGRRKTGTDDYTITIGKNGLMFFLKRKTRGYFVEWRDVLRSAMVSGMYLHKKLAISLATKNGQVEAKK